MTLRRLPKGLCLLLTAAASGCDSLAAITSPPDGGTPGIVSTDGAGGGNPMIVESDPSCPTPNGAAAVAKGAPIAGSSAMPSLVAGLTVKSTTQLPPISGGTMLTTADGSMIVASDPDRDQIYFVDALGMRSLHTRKLNEGDEPGRVVEDAAGRIHVVLRSGRGIATLGRDADSEITRREVCDVPRGIAYDPKGDQLHITCAEGQLVTLAAAPTALMPTRTLDVPSDVRDVLVRDGQLLVSRFRSAELLMIDADGAVEDTRAPATFARDEMRKALISKRAQDGSCITEGGVKLVHVEETPDVAWRMIDVPTAGVAMLHQRAHADEIQVTSGGYGASSGCGGSGIVQSAITMGIDKQTMTTVSITNLTLAVDIAADSQGQMLAVVAPGNYGGNLQIELIPVSALREQETSPGGNASPMQPTGGSFATGATPSTGSPNVNQSAPCAFGTNLPEPEGQATAVTFVSPNVLAVQTREPSAAVSFYDIGVNTLLATVKLDTASRFDTGHAMFHMRTGAGLACASCHPEAGDDGHTWTFATIGPRRTQTLRGGILGTEPLHWNGDMKDFNMLMSEVFVGRMSGFVPSADQTDALTHWLDNQPALHASVPDKSAAERGQELFESSAVGCATCHAGEHLTNNTTVNVGTGVDLQVPSLRGVKFRTPLMHNGCAANITERLTHPECGGGDKHGKTSQLNESQVNDLTAYLETL
ncbi:MAG TPA: cytochrome c [Polyangiales bacterium]|nr:cytochrome c [Polyangiales bacterium]